MSSSAPAAVGHAAVIGGGLAGCASARALAEHGWHVTLFERHATLAGDTSGNIAGAVYPKFSLHETPQNRWYRDSYLFALSRLPQLLGEPDGSSWARCGLLQLPVEKQQNLAAIAASGRWPDTVLRHVERDEASALAGIAMPSAGLWFPDAAWVNPPALCQALSQHARITLCLNTTVQQLDHDGRRPRIDGHGFDAVVIANSLTANTWQATATLPLRRVRGQVTHIVATEASRALRAIVCHNGYATPARACQPDTQSSSRDLHSIGATFGPRDRDPDVRAADHAKNLAQLATACPALHSAIGGANARIDGGRTGFRIQTPDYLPLIGPVADHDTYQNAAIDSTPPALPGLYLLTALGAKGIAFALTGAEIIAAHASDSLCPVDNCVRAALDPSRFMIRSRRRG